MGTDRSIAGKCFVVAILLAVSLGCAPRGPYVSRHELSKLVRGPGSVFSSIDDAAADALAWCYVHENRNRFTGRLRAGTIGRAEGGGYTYGEVATESILRQGWVKYTLRPDDVAHFRFYPVDTEWRGSLGDERHSLNDRRIVDELDPLHRASYLLTQNGEVVIYAGGGQEWELGKLADWARGTERWAGRPRVGIEDVDPVDQ